jgi:hypothetical protein
MRHIITLLLMLPLLADAQIYIDSYRFGIPPVPGLLLDSFPGAAAAYSLRKLDNDYTGNCITVQRDNGDTSLIGFDMNYLDTAAMKTFCGEGAGDSCRVRRWWDQSGNNRNFFQDTMARQPLVMANGVVLRDNGEVSLRFDGSNDAMSIPSSTAMFNFIHNGDDATIFSVQRFGNTASPDSLHVLLSNHNTGNAVGFTLAYDDRPTIASDRLLSVVGNSTALSILSRIDDIVAPNVMSLCYWKIDANNATAANRGRVGVNGGVDAGNNTDTAAPSASNAQTNLVLGRVGNVSSFLLSGAVNEIIIYNSDQSSNRAAIETNINTFYSIY